jgi:hypothetical protein
MTGTRAEPSFEARTSPASARKGKPLGRQLTVLLVAVLGVLLVLATALVGTYFGLGLHRTDQAATIVPAETTAFISVSPSLWQLRQLLVSGDVGSEVAFLAPIAGLLAAGQDVPSDIPLDLDIDPGRDILPWIGREVSVAVVPGSGFRADFGSRAALAAPAPGTMQAYEQPALVLAAATRSRRSSDRFLEGLREQLEERGFEFSTSMYRGVVVTEALSPGEVPIAYATVNRLVVLATDPASLEEAIDASLGAGGPVLASSDRFDDLVSRLPRNRLGYAYVNAAQLAADAVQDLDQVGGLGAIDSLAVAASLRDDGLSLTFAAQYDVMRLPELVRQQLTKAPNPNRLAERVPSGALVYVSGQDLAHTWQSLLASEGGELLEQLGSSGGADAADGLLSGFSGEYAIAVSADSGGLLGDTDVPIGLVALFDMAHRADAERSADELGDLFSGLVGGQPVAAELDGAQVWMVQDSYGGGSLSYGVVGDKLVVASSLDLARQVVESAGESLAESDRFREAVKPLPGRNRGYMYVDVELAVRALDWMLDDMARREFNESVRPYVQGVRTVALAAEPMDADGIVRGVLFVCSTGD